MPRSRFLVRLVCGVFTLQLIIFGLIIWNHIRLFGEDWQGLWQRSIQEHILC